MEQEPYVEIDAQGRRIFDARTGSNCTKANASDNLTITKTA
jgi:hypothetical protein